MGGGEETEAEGFDLVLGGKKEKEEDMRQQLKLGAWETSDF